MTVENSSEDKTIIQKILARIRTLSGKKDGLEEISVDIEDTTPKDLSPEDVIELFDLKPKDIPARIQEGFKGIPDHIVVLNEVHLENGTPAEFYGSKEDSD